MDKPFLALPQVNKVDIPGNADAARVDQQVPDHIELINARTEGHLTAALAAGAALAPAYHFLGLDHPAPPAVRVHGVGAQPVRGPGVRRRPEINGAAVRRRDVVSVPAVAAGAAPEAQALSGQEARY